MSDEGTIFPRRQAVDRVQDRPIREGLRAFGRRGIHPGLQRGESGFHEDPRAPSVVVDWSLSGGILRWDGLGLGLSRSRRQSVASSGADQSESEACLRKVRRELIQMITRGTDGLCGRLPQKKRAGDEEAEHKGHLSPVICLPRFDSGVSSVAASQAFRCLRTYTDSERR